MTKWKILFAGCLVFFSIPAIAQERTFTQGIALLDSIYTRIAKSYVEKPVQEHLFRAGIDASLGTLDPYTNYFNKQETEDFNLSLKARYGGIGFVIGPMNDSIFTKELFKGTPADRSGIRPGDRVIQVDSISIKGRHINDVFPLLMGQPGTVVRVKLFRPSTGETLVVTPTRELIQLPSVPYYGMLTDGIGYIKITGEVESTGEEVRKALLELKKKPSLKGLVLDLRGNIGGLMREAISVANLFVEKGKVAVSEKSWYSDTSYYFKNDPVDPSIPLVVLVDDQTASSGEILAGALQDHDRAILVGQKTFGKGMVQRLFNLPNGELLKVTTSFYHTPSGRCIQRKEKGGERTQGWTDSLKKTVHTVNGRPVISFDGITPDIEMTREPAPTVIKDLKEWESTHLFRFANQYLVTHPVIPAAAQFRITDSDYDAFIAFLKKENFQLSSASEKKLDELEKTLQDEGYSEALATYMASLRTKLGSEKEKQFVVYKKQIKSLLEGEIMLQSHYNSGRVENSLKDDEEVRKAVEVLSEWGKYKRLLNL